MSEDHIWKVAQSVGFDDYELRPMLEAFAAALSKPAPSPQPAAPVVPDDHPLMIFARECELGTYMEHETPMAARKAISAAKAKEAEKL